MVTKVQAQGGWGHEHYRVGGANSCTHFQPFRRQHLGGEVDAGDPMIDFAQARVDENQIQQAFVIDTADTPEGPRVIECNNFCSAGLYAANVGKIVEAIEALQEPGSCNISAP